MSDTNTRIGNLLRFLSLVPIFGFVLAWTFEFSFFFSIGVEFFLFFEVADLLRSSILFSGPSFAALVAIQLSGFFLGVLTGSATRSDKTDHSKMPLARLLVSTLLALAMTIWAWANYDTWTAICITMTFLFLLAGFYLRSVGGRLIPSETLTLGYLACFLASMVALNMLVASDLAKRMVGSWKVSLPYIELHDEELAMTQEIRLLRSLDKWAVTVDESGFVNLTPWDQIKRVDLIRVLKEVDSTKP